MPRKKLKEDIYPRINKLCRERFRGTVIWPDTNVEEYKEGLTQEELAILLSIPKTHRDLISNYEHGKEAIDLKTIIKMADILNCSIDTLLNRPINVTFNYQSNNLRAVGLTPLGRGHYQIDDETKGDIKLDAKFYDRGGNIAAYLLESDCEVLHLLKGDVIIVDKGIKDYINSYTNDTYYCLISEPTVKKHSVVSGYYFSEVGICRDINGVEKKRSFYYKTFDGTLKVVGCQVIQRLAVAVVIQTVHYCMKDRPKDK